EKTLTELAAKLEIERTNAARRLEQVVNQMLGAVGFKNAVFRIEIARTSGEMPFSDETVGLTASGFNVVRFLVSANVGSPLRPLEEVASGGEISRILLAVKAALAEKMSLPLLIFDEIDTGVGGETALKVGRMLEALAQGHQLLVVTHLPQIASRNGVHFYVYKETREGRTTSRIVRLEGENRAAHIAKMMSGAETPSDAALRSAKELIAG
ncbi:MAG: DNA repair protein RecN, partial [Bacteroidia bacterium]|nr:DNA repair protein RecN [Bacteroidia bacterium]